jgi:hypothetical protein
MNVLALIWLCMVFFLAGLIVGVASRHKGN